MLFVVDNSRWQRLNHLVDTRLAEQLSRTLQALHNTWRPFMQAMGVRSNTMNQPFLKQSSESMEVLLNCTITLRMSNNWNNSKRPQFKNHSLSFREPGATPQLQ